MITLHCLVSKSKRNNNNNITDDKNNAKSPGRNIIYVTQWVSERGRKKKEAITKRKPAVWGRRRVFIEFARCKCVLLSSGHINFFTLAQMSPTANAPPTAFVSTVTYCLRTSHKHAYTRTRKVRSYPLKRIIKGHTVYTFCT